MVIRGEVKEVLKNSFSFFHSYTYNNVSITSLFSKDITELKGG